MFLQVSEWVFDSKKNEEVMLGDSFLSQNLVYEREKTNPFAAGPTMEAVIVALFFSAILILLMIAMFLVACRIFLPGAFAYLRGRYSELRRAAAPDIYRVELNTNGEAVIIPAERSVETEDV